MFGWFKKPKPQDPFVNGPYRTNVAPIQKIINMNMPKIGKYTKTFSLTLPVAVASVTGGMVHDMPVIGDGMKIGCYGALALLSLFFLFVAGTTLTAKQQQ